MRGRVGEAKGKRGGGGDQDRRWLGEEEKEEQEGNRVVGGEGRAENRVVEGEGRAGNRVVGGEGRAGNRVVGGGEGRTDWYWRDTVWVRSGFPCQPLSLTRQS
ncbi:hypothetical protein Pmani_027848 [Petrolisthes manimaculis]|uniref:Uncharacterized protein n=1 Tax=Petrolisthes manimaculis TaxID=1843537 RepID=A0AAE1TW37_9EUCA|nr:hypothetical protein Pmani_027848 [Petrolisthes manimaculis]